MFSFCRTSGLASSPDVHLLPNIRPGEFTGCSPSAEHQSWRVHRMFTFCRTSGMTSSPDVLLLPDIRPGKLTGCSFSAGHQAGEFTGCSPSAEHQAWQVHRMFSFCRTSGMSSSPDVLLLPNIRPGKFTGCSSPDTYSNVLIRENIRKLKQLI